MRHFLLIAFFLVGTASANELGTPKGEVLLTISGNITNTNSEHGAEFDLEMLEQLGETSITTSSPWTDFKTKFTGTRLDVLLAAVGAKSSEFRAEAVDSYWYDVTDTDFSKYPVVVAYKRDGEYMTARSLGPLWIMYPFDDFPELLTHTSKAACVWQLNSLVVK